MGIGLLGPLEIDGREAALSPRDRIVLQALALRPGSVVGAETLAAALWPADSRPASWPKVVQGCIVRLRKRLGADRIETLPHGYRLALAIDEIDHQRFERLVGRAGELIALGEADRAAYLADEALALWRGDPLLDLDEWDTGRLERDRLTQLRRDAEELRVKAEIVCGRHVQVLPDARRLVQEEPLREDRWGLLARALYQAGQQAEALRTLRTARTVLLRELGLDPGPDLVELERAILQQDPTLVADSALPSASGTCPYPGLPAYDVRDAEVFFGRERDTFAALRRLRDAQVLAIVGPSGSGKSSLARAGVAAALQREGKRVVVVTPGVRPTSVLTGTASRAAVLVVDQLEEALSPEVDADERARFFEALTDRGARQLVVTLRADRLGDLATFPDFAHLVEQGLYLLGSMGEADLRRAVEGPALHAGLRLEPGLVDLLVREVEGQPGALPLLSHALRQTWERREGQTLTVDGYLASGGIREAVSQTAEEVYRKSDDAEKAMLRDLVMRLVSLGPEGEASRVRVPRHQVAGDQRHADIVEQLVTARLVSSDDDAVQIAHEALVRGWPRLRAWLDEDIDGQRILRHLVVTAENWDTMGRPESELYRGVRQAQATEWRRRVRPHLTPAERDFLDAGELLAEQEQRATEEKIRYQRRVNRRLSVLLAAAAVLLAAALGAGAVAVGQADRAATEATRAEAEAVAAEARRLGAQALTATDVDTALLLAVEGVRRDSSSDTRANLLAALSRSPELVGIARNGAVGDLTVDREDGWLAESSPAGVTVRDPRTLDVAGRFSPGSATSVTFSPDGRHLAMTLGAWTPSGMRPHEQPIQILDAATLRPTAVQLGGQPNGRLVDLALDYDPTGRYLAAAFHHLTRPQAQIVMWDTTRPQRPVTRIDVERFVPRLHVLPHGRSVVATTILAGGGGSVRLYDARNGDLRREAGPYDTDITWPVLALAPDASAVAVSDNSTVSVLSLPGLRQVTRLRADDGSVTAVDFSPDGRLLATGTDDHKVAVWSIEEGVVVDDLDGHSGYVMAVQFSHDGTTLFSAGPDGRLMAWDLSGERRFAPERRLPTPDEWPVLNRISPRGDRAAFIVGFNPTKVQIQDLTTGRLSQVMDTGHPTAQSYDLAWSPDGSRLATYGEHGTVHVWDPTTLTGEGARRVSSQEIFSVSFSHDGRHLLVGARKGHLYVLDSETLEETLSVRLRSGDVLTAVASSPEGGSALVASGDGFEGALHRVDLRSGVVEQSLEVPWVPYAIAYSPDGRRAAVGGSNGDVGLLDTGTLEWRRTPVHAHRNQVWTVRFSPDGSRFLSANVDLVHLWNGESGRPEGALSVPGVVDEIDVVFRRRGDDVLISTLDGRTLTWDTRVEAWIEAACRIAGRNLDPVREWAEYLPDRPYRETCPGQEQSTASSG